MTGTAKTVRRAAPFQVRGTLSVWHEPDLPQVGRRHEKPLPQRGPRLPQQNTARTGAPPESRHATQQAAAAPGTAKTSTSRTAPETARSDSGAALQPAASETLQAAPAPLVPAHRTRSRALRPGPWGVRC